MNNKSITITLIATFIVAVVGLVAYQGLLEPAATPEKQFTKIEPEKNPAVKEALAKQKEEEFQAGEVITDGETTIVTKALPPGGNQFLKELNEISQGIEQDLKQEAQNTADLGDEIEIERIIAEGKALISEVDAKHNLGTQAFLSEMLGSEPQTTDPELIELDTKIENLESEAEDILRSLQ